jgi:hypothetical protein
MKPSAARAFNPVSRASIPKCSVIKKMASVPLNLAVYWKRRYRGKGPKEPWYILTNLPHLATRISHVSGALEHRADV